MNIEHVAMYVNDPDAARDFFIKYLGARSNDGYRNPNTGFRSYFLSFDGGARLTAKLRVEGGCIGCGLCAKKCPVQAIEMRDGKPVWVKDKCVMCLGCMHRCPKFAIQYGENTQRHGQYTNPNVKL